MFSSPTAVQDTVKEHEHAFFRLVVIGEQEKMTCVAPT